MTRINLQDYPLEPTAKDKINQLLGTNCQLTLSQLWQLIDQAWMNYGCNNKIYDHTKYCLFYSDVIWTLNGIYAEQDSLSQRIRYDIVNQVVLSRATMILDWGGGIGTLARMLVQRDQGIKVDILEPYPSDLGLSLCDAFHQVSFIRFSLPIKYEFVLCIDVLEHLHEPLEAINEIYNSLRSGGYVLFANCFEPVIQCHLPKTFYLRYGFRWICLAKGLRLVRKNPGSYSETYIKVGRPFPLPAQKIIIVFFRAAFPLFDAFSFGRTRLRSVLLKLFKRRSFV
jgi:2-polyprenyl-6-hydroxyphenyl methylase/3-demethylubiquinone-9 3-methyltransferase